MLAKLAVLAVAGSCVGFTCEPRKVASDEAPRAAAAASCVAGGPTWPVGRSVYEIDMASQVGLATAGAMVDFHLRSDVAVWARELSKGVTQLAVSLPNASFESTSPDDRSKFESIAAELKQPFVFTLSRGRLTEVRLRAGWSRFADSISRTLAAALQFPEKKEPAADVWAGAEADATGDYEAEYRCMSALAVTKRKLKYAAAALGTVSFGQVMGKLTPEVVSSDGKIALKSSSASAGALGGLELEHLEYQEKLSLPVSTTGRMISQTGLKVTFKRQDAERFDWDAALSATKAMAPSEAPRIESPPDAYDSTRIGEYTFTKALLELERYSQDPKSNALFSSVRDVPLEPAQQRNREELFRDQGRVFTAMAAILRAKPENIPLAAAAVRRGSPAKTALMDALASAGTPAAQHTLVVLMEDERLDKIQGKAAYALMRVAKATPEAVGALARHVEDNRLRVYALYGLGTIGRHLREAGEDARANAITRLLTQALEKAEKPAIQVHVLRGIANSGDSGAFAAVRPFSSAEVDKVRAAAVDAVRLMQNPEVDQLIAERLEKDEQTVQLAALDAVAVRNPSDVLVVALEHAARGAEKPVVRIKAVNVAAQLLPRRPQLRSLLEQLAQGSEYEQVRKAAASALKG